MAPSKCVKLSIISLCAFNALALPHGSSSDNDGRPANILLDSAVATIDVAHFSKVPEPTSDLAGAVNHAVPSEVLLRSSSIGSSAISNGTASAAATPTSVQMVPDPRNSEALSKIEGRPVPLDSAAQPTARGIDLKQRRAAVPNPQQPAALVASLGPLIPAGALQPAALQTAVAASKPSLAAPAAPAASAIVFPAFVATAAPATAQSAAPLIPAAAFIPAAALIPSEPKPIALSPKAPLPQQALIPMPVGAIAPQPVFNSIVPMASIMPPLGAPVKPTAAVSMAAPVLAPSPQLPFNSIVPIASIMPPIPVPVLNRPTVAIASPSFANIVPIASIMPPIPAPVKPTMAAAASPSFANIVPIASIMPPLQPIQASAPSASVLLPVIPSFQPSVIDPAPFSSPVQPTTPLAPLLPNALTAGMPKAPVPMSSGSVPLLFTLQPTSLLPMPPAALPTSINGLRPTILIPPPLTQPSSSAPMIMPTLTSASLVLVSSLSAISLSSVKSESVVMSSALPSSSPAPSTTSKFESQLSVPSSTTALIASSTTVKPSSVQESSAKSSASSRVSRSSSSESRSTAMSSSPSESKSSMVSSSSSTLSSNASSTTPSTLSITAPKTTVKPDIPGRLVGVVILDSVTYTIGVLPDGNLQFGSGAVITANAAEKVVDGQTLSFGADGLIVNHLSTFPIKAAVSATATPTSSSSSSSAKPEQPKSTASSSRTSSTRKGGISSPTGGFTQGDSMRLDSAGEKLSVTDNAMVMIFLFLVVLFFV